MHILISPNAYKNSLSATAAADAIAEGLEQSEYSGTFECFPIGDGGDGTAELIMQKCEGEPITANAHDPLGRMMSASFGLIEKRQTAIIEMAAASGLRLLKPEELNPLRASSAGTGELMKHALDLGVKKIILAMGGSATVDGGTGILSALGLQFLEKNGEALHNLPASLSDLASINNSGLDERIHQTEIIILCDVDNRLLGEKGAAAVFGPQKGADKEAISKLESALEKFTAVVLHQKRINMAALKFGGTAGGAAAGLHALLNARLENGIAYFLHLTGFEKALMKADVVITGEGRIDEQTLQGKGPMGVATMAKEKGKMVIGLAGQLPPAITPDFRKYFDLLLPISAEPLELKLALARTTENLRRVSKEIGNQISELINKK